MRNDIMSSLHCIEFKDYSDGNYRSNLVRKLIELDYYLNTSIYNNTSYVELIGYYILNITGLNTRLSTSSHKITFWTSMINSKKIIGKIYEKWINRYKLGRLYMQLTVSGSVFLSQLMASKAMGHEIKPSLNNRYCVDLMYLKEYQVESNILQYGAKLVLNPDMKVNYIILPNTPEIIQSVGYKLGYTSSKTVIYKCNNKEFRIYPGDDMWQLGYNIFISSLVAHIFINDYIIGIKFFIGEHFKYVINQVGESKLTNIIRLILIDEVEESDQIDEVDRLEDMNKADMMEERKCLEIGSLLKYRDLTVDMFGFTKDGISKLYLDRIVKYKGIYNMNDDMGEIITTMIDEINKIDLIDDQNHVQSIIYLIEKLIPGITKHNNCTREIFTESNTKLFTILKTLTYNFVYRKRIICDFMFNIFNPKLLKTKVYSSYPLIELDLDTFNNIDIILNNFPDIKCIWNEST